MSTIRKVLKELPDCNRVQVFRYMVAVLKRDPLIRRLSPQFNAWEGSADDLREFGQNVKVGIRLSPQGAGEQWSDANAISGPLQIHVHLHVQTLCSDDVENLWHAVILAFFRPGEPADAITGLSPGQKIFQDLEARGCLGSLLEVTQDVSITPIEEASGKITHLEGTGMLRINVRQIINI